MRPRAALVAVVLIVAACASPLASVPASEVSPSLAPTPTPTPARATSAAGLPIFSPTEPLLAFNRLTGDGGGVLVERPDGSARWELGTDVPGVRKRVDWSPDGTSIAFATDDSGEVWIAHLDGSPSTQVYPCVSGCDFPAWSPDGKHIAFSRAESGPGVGPGAVGIYVADLATDAYHVVVRLERPLLADAPHWSPDGRRLVFQVERLDDQGNDTGAAIAVADARGGEPIYLTDFASFGTTPDWDWTTNEIVFSTQLQSGHDAGGGALDLWLVKPDGTGLRRLTHLPSGHVLIGPRWLADGSGISAFDLGAGTVVLVDPATGDVRPYGPADLLARPIMRPLPRE